MACASLLLCSPACDQPPTPSLSPTSTAAAYPQANAPLAGAPANVAGSAATAGDHGAQTGTAVGAAPLRPRVSLIDHARWTRLERADDPFPDRPTELDCAAEAVAPELLAGEPALGVDTGGCSYVTVRQATRAQIAIGETVIVRLWHFALSAPAPGQAHAALHVGSVVVLDERVAIPAPGGLIKVQAPVDRAIPAGAPVHFHLHNHGANSWALVEVSVGPPDAP
jgi:hypothetical protein